MSASTDAWPSTECAQVFQCVFSPRLSLPASAAVLPVGPVALESHGRSPRPAAHWYPQREEPSVTEFSYFIQVSTHLDKLKFSLSDIQMQLWLKSTLCLRTETVKEDKAGGATRSKHC